MMIHPGPAGMPEQPDDDAPITEPLGIVPLMSMADLDRDLEAIAEDARRTAAARSSSLVRDSRVRPTIRDPNPAADIWRGSAPSHPAPWTPIVTNPDPWATDPGFTTTVRSTRPSWSLNGRTMVISAVILAALLALITAVVILMTREPTQPDRPAPAPTTSTSPATTTPVTSDEPPLPPLTEAPPPAEPSYPRTYYPRTPSPERPNVTTPQTRGPEISVRPTHRPAFPGQPGQN